MASAITPKDDNAKGKGAKVIMKKQYREVSGRSKYPGFRSRHT